MNNEVYQKFIIEKIHGKLHLIMGKVTYHRDLTNKPENVVSGGWWERKIIDNIIIFLGSSDQFGPASQSEIEECVKFGRVFSNRSLNKNISDDFKFHILSAKSEEIPKIYNLKLTDDELFYALTNRFQNNIDNDIKNAIEKINSQLKLNF